MKTHGLRRGTARVACGVWVSFAPGPGGRVFRLDPVEQPTILTTRDYRKMTCLRCQTAKHRLTKRDLRY